jgi:hypothetical protein
MRVLAIGLVSYSGLLPLAYAAEYFINSAGGDCAAIGTWNATTTTCTLAGNVIGSIEIMSDGVTLDGNGHVLIGPGINGSPPYGVYI